MTGLTTYEEEKYNEIVDTINAGIYDKNKPHSIAELFGNTYSSPRIAKFFRKQIIADKVPGVSMVGTKSSEGYYINV